MSNKENFNWALPIQWPFAMVGGTRLHTDLSVGACRLAASLGFLQIVASTFSGFGACALLTSWQWQAGPPPWSWPLCAACVVFFIVLDMSLNHLLNLVHGWGHWVLKVMRLVLTVCLSLMASQMLLLVLNASALDEPALNIASSRFDESLKPLAKALADAQTGLTSAQTAVAAHVKLVPQLPTTMLGQDPSANILPEGDDSGRRIQASILRQRASLIAQANMTLAAQQKAFDQGLQALKQSVTDAKERLDTAKDAHTKAEQRRGETVVLQANTSALRVAAFAKLRTQDPGLDFNYYLLIALGLLFETFALIGKTAAAFLDEGALSDQVELMDRSIDLQSQATVNGQIMRFLQGVATSNWAKEAVRDACRRILESHINEKSTQAVSARIFDFRQRQRP